MERNHDYGGGRRLSNGETEHAFRLCSRLALALALLL
jgi:hypothetical protein